MCWAPEITSSSWEFDFPLEWQSLWSGRCSEHVFQGGYARSCVDLMSHSWSNSSLMPSNTKQVTDLSVCKLKTTSNLKLKQSENNVAFYFVNRSALNFRGVRTLGLQKHSGISLWRVQSQTRVEVLQVYSSKICF